MPVGIVDEDIARVREATDFVAVAAEHVALRRVGRRWVALCPFHVEKSPSFSLSPEHNVFYCFGCGKGGDVITFVRELDHLDFAEAVEKLAARAGIALRYDDEATGRDHQRRTRVHDTLAAAVAWYHDRLLTAPDAAAARRYLRTERGYDGDVVRQYKLGWAPEGWDRLVRSLPVPPGALVDAGLAFFNDSGRYTDSFRGRLIFPIFEAGGRAVGIGGRILPGGTGPKYKNTPNTLVYDKSRVLYGLNLAKTSVVESNRVVVCEGYTDVIGLHRAGVTQAVATCGTALSEGHIRLLTNFARRIVLAYDADSAGQAAAERFYEWEQRYEVDIRVAALPPGADPADLARTDPGALQAAVDDARPFLAFQIERQLGRADLQTGEGRVRAATAAMALIGAHPNALVRDQYLMDVAGRCRIEPDQLRTLGRALPAGPAGGAGAGTSGGGGGSGGADGAGGRPGLRPPGGGGRRLEGGPAVPGTEIEALRLAVHRPEEVADRLEEVLFSHPLARRVFACLASSATLFDAIELADPPAAALLQRLAVEEAEEETDDVMVRLVERAGAGALRELQADVRAAEDPTDYVATIAWLKLALEDLRAPTLTPGSEEALEAQARLLGWLSARTEAADE